MSKERHRWPAYAPNRAGGYITIKVWGCLALFFLGNLVMTITVIIPMGAFLLEFGYGYHSPEVPIVGIVLALGLTIWIGISVVALGGWLIWRRLRSLRHAKQ